MTSIVLFGGRAARRAAWGPHLRNAFADAGLDVRLCMDPEQPEARDARYVLCEKDGAVADFDRFPRLRAICSLWAGVDWLVARNNLPAKVRLLRMVDDALTRGMTEYVLAHVLRYHLDLDAQTNGDRAARWDDAALPLAADRRVGVMGLGVLGGAAAAALRDIGFATAGWSRTRRSLPGVATFAGSCEMHPFLNRTDILVLLLPETRETVNVINAGSLAQLPTGARLINAARGALVEDAALLAALDSGRLAHATLDVFREEPLPAEHPYRGHAGVTVTPHLASVTRPAFAARTVARQIRQIETGTEPTGIVDPVRGY